MQLKHKLEHEVESMENEIVQLKADLEGDSVIEETKMSDEENVARAGDYVQCEKVACVVAHSKNQSNLAQKSACQNDQKTDLLQEYLHNTVELNFESGWSLQHDTDRNMSSQECVELTSKPCHIVSDLPSTHVDVTTCSLFSAASETVVCDQNVQLVIQQEVVSDSVKEAWTVSETEDWPELSANTVKMLCEPMLLPHDTTDRQCVGENTSKMDDDDDGSANIKFFSKKRPDDTSIGTDIWGASSSVGDCVCSMPAAVQVDVFGAELTVNESCIQLASADGLGQETVCAVPDSLDGIPAACDIANNGLEDDTDSCVSCEDIVIPDSEDDLFCSPHNGHNGDIDCAAAMSCPDVSKDVNMIVNVSNISNDVCEQFEKVDGMAQPVNISDTHSSEMIPHASVDTLARSGKKEQCRSTEKSSIINHMDISQCNQNNNICMSDADSADMMKHKLNMHADFCLAEESHLSSTNETIDAAFELHQQLTSSSVVYEQLPKRTHWTFVASGISQAVDQVIFPATDC